MWISKSLFHRRNYQETQELWNKSTKSPNMSLSIDLSTTWRMKGSFTKSRLILFSLASFLWWVANYARSKSHGTTFITCSQKLASPTSIYNLSFQWTKLEAPSNLKHSPIPRIILHILKQSSNENNCSKWSRHNPSKGPSTSPKRPRASCPTTSTKVKNLSQVQHN